MSGDKWYAVYRESDGALHSTTTVLADPMPDEFEAKEIDEQPENAMEWDKENLIMVDIE